VLEDASDDGVVHGILLAAMAYGGDRMHALMPDCITGYRNHMSCAWAGQEVVSSGFPVGSFLFPGV